MALGHIQEICSSFDLLTSSFLRIRINKYCLSVMGRSAWRKQAFNGKKQPILKKSCRLKYCQQKYYLRKIMKLWCPGTGDQIPFVQRGFHFPLIMKPFYQIWCKNSIFSHDPKIFEKWWVFCFKINPGSSYLMGYCWPPHTGPTGFLLCPHGWPYVWVQVSLQICVSL